MRRTTATSWLIAVSASLLVPLPAVGQITFANIAWSSNLETVHRKLIEEGFSGCSLTNRAACQILGKCICNFSGQGIEDGWATFDDGRLGEVNIRIAEESSVWEKLNRKYGKPRLVEQRRTGLFAPLYSGSWVSANGDTVNMENNFLRYRGAWRNYRIGDDAERRRSHF